MQQYTAVVYSTAVVLVASCLLTFIYSKRSFHAPARARPLHAAACMMRRALLYVTHITVRDKVRVVKVVRGNSSKRVKGIEIWLMSIYYP